MMQTNMLRGILKKLMMVERLSSGTYWLRIFIMLGQKMPTHASNTQKASSWILPSKVIPVNMPTQSMNSLCCFATEHRDGVITKPVLAFLTTWVSGADAAGR